MLNIEYVEMINHFDIENSIEGHVHRAQEAHNVSFKVTLWRKSTSFGYQRF